MTCRIHRIRYSKGSTLTISGIRKPIPHQGTGCRRLIPKSLLKTSVLRPRNLRVQGRAPPLSLVRPPPLPDADHTDVAALNQNGHGDPRRRHHRGRRNALEEDPHLEELEDEVRPTKT